MTRYLVLIAILISLQTHSDSVDETFIQCGTDYFFRIDETFKYSRMYRITHKRESVMAGWFDESAGSFFYSGSNSIIGNPWGRPKTHVGVILNKHPDDNDAYALGPLRNGWQWGLYIDRVAGEAWYTLNENACASGCGEKINDRSPYPSVKAKRIGECVATSKRKVERRLAKLEELAKTKRPTKVKTKF